jgi:hypothetical protein
MHRLAAKEYPQTFRHFFVVGSFGAGGGVDF